MRTEKLRRVAVTGIGIVSSIGCSMDEVTHSLQNGQAGIKFSQDYADRGFRSQVYGYPNLNPASRLSRRQLRFLGDGAAWCHIALEDAIADSGLEQHHISHPRTGLIIGSGGPSTRTLIEAADTARQKSPKRVSPFSVPKAMSSTCSATLATNFKILGVNYSVSSACTTSLHCIGSASEQIQWNKQDIVFAGGGEELEWSLSVLFDAMGALSSRYNDQPLLASRPFDTQRDGFVIAGGAGIIVLEEMEHARKRGANIYAELTGYAANSDGYDMVAPSGKGAVQVMKMALQDAQTQPDYINPHATATLAGDTKELEAIQSVFGHEQPTISATKAMTGHSLGGAGAQEAIYCLLMMKNSFAAPSINISQLDPAANGMNIARETREMKIKSAISTSFGFGGTNGAVVFSQV